MKERLSRKKLSAVAGIFVVLALFAGILLVSAVIFIAADMLGIKQYYQFGVFVLLIALGVIIVRKWLTEFEYAVVDDELVVERFIGSRNKQLLRIRLKDIVSVGQDRPAGPLQRLTYHSKRHGVTYIVYRQSGEEQRAFFSPSAALLELIDKRRSIKPQATE